MKSKENDKMQEKADTIFKTRSGFSEKRYQNRNDYENLIKRSLSDSKCILVRGNSGCGKTWLVTYVLKKENKKYQFINLSNAKKYGSLNEYFSVLCTENQTLLEKGAESGTTLSISNVLSFEKHKNKTGTYSVKNDNYLNFLNKNKGQYLVFDNFETITDNHDILTELGDIITLVDDESILKTKTHIILLGTNNDVVRFFEQLPNYQTIGNRMIQIKEIKGFTENETRMYVESSFKELNINLNGDFIDFIYKKTNGVPQYVNELCLIVVENYLKQKMTKKATPKADTFHLQDFATAIISQWLNNSFIAEYMTILHHYKLNDVPKKTKQNRILFLIGEMDKMEVDCLKLLTTYTEYFDEDIGKNVIKKYLSNVLADPSKNNQLVNIKDEKEGLFVIRSAKTLLCLRNALFLDEEVVKIFELDEIEA